MSRAPKICGAVQVKGEHNARLGHIFKLCPAFVWPDWFAGQAGLATIGSSDESEEHEVLTDSGPAIDRLAILPKLRGKLQTMCLKCRASKKAPKRGFVAKP